MATRTVEALFPLLLLLLISSSLLVSSSGSDPHKKRCLQECRGIPEHLQWKECVHQCLDHSGHGEAGREQQQEEEAWGAHRRQYNPYYFDQHSYQHWTRTEHGQFKVLESFGKRSKLLMGVENYRLAVLEAEPQTFVMPSHLDAENVLYVMEGSGTITLLHGENRESHNIKRGHIMRIPAGAIVYAINRARNEKLRIAMLLQPISTPGHVEEFFGAAGRNPESFYTSFSNEVLEAAFNTPREKLDRLFRRQRKGQIIKITQEQIRTLSQSTSEGSAGSAQQPSTGSHEPYNLLQNSPSHSNEHGELHEASANDCHQLRHLDVAVSIANISQGSMMAPYYNSHSTEMAMVVDGSGYIEMACPHHSGESEAERELEGHHHHRVHYQTVRSQVSRGSVFVFPAGYPVAAVAAPNQSLQVLSFSIRTENNRRQYLAGKNNVLNRLNREAKELAFGARAEEVDEVLNAQPESAFVPGPGHREEEERGWEPSLESLLSFAWF